MVVSNDEFSKYINAKIVSINICNDIIHIYIRKGNNKKVLSIIAPLGKIEEYKIIRQEGSNTVIQPLRVIEEL